MSNEAQNLARLRGRFPELADDLERLSRGTDAAAASSPGGAPAEFATDALELAAHGRADEAERLLSERASSADDFELYQTFDDLQRQRAIDRAAASSTLDEARRWVLLAVATAKPPVVPPILVAVGGLIASGKSTVARLAADAMNAPRVEADRAREFLTRGGRLQGLAPSIEDAVYDEMLRRARLVLGSGRAVVLDACFPRREHRERAREMARARGWPFVFIECRVDAETTRQRLSERERALGESSTGAWQKLYAALARRWQSTDHLADGELLVLDCTRPLEETASLVRKRVRAAPPGHRLP